MKKYIVPDDPVVGIEMAHVLMPIEHTCYANAEVKPRYPDGPKPRYIWVPMALPVEVADDTQLPPSYLIAGPEWEAA